MLSRAARAGNGEAVGLRCGVAGESTGTTTCQASESTEEQSCQQEVECTQALCLEPGHKEHRKGYPCSAHSESGSAGAVEGT